MIEVLRLALKALNAGEHAHLVMNTDGIKDKVRQAIAGLESQEPVAWMKPDVLCDRACMYLCTKGFTQFPECATIHPPQRTWVGLTDEERNAIEAATLDLHGVPKFFATAIEAKLKEKNNA